MGIFDNFKVALSGGNSKSPIAALPQPVIEEVA